MEILASPRLVALHALAGLNRSVVVVVHGMETPATLRRALEGINHNAVVAVVVHGTETLAQRAARLAAEGINRTVLVIVRGMETLAASCAFRATPLTPPICLGRV